ncbi:hypothetical protein S646_003437 [Salmonella enterica subsp. enterica]|nr:hypothetical protein [Salmonella enterica subsp. enterica]EDR9185129.1 hypothetical protein [Salmonella enterica subsp. enterica]
MTIDKQVLRQIAESVDREEWYVLDNGDADYQVIVSGSLERGATYRSYQPVTNEISNKKIAAFIAAFNPKVALALLNEVEAAEHTVAVDHEASCSLVEENEELKRKLEAENQRNTALTAKIEPMDRRIAELERSETQLINERDSAESALNDAYKAVMGQAPEWSNWFSFENAIDEIELACELWRNQTDDVIQFRQRIQELEKKLANPVLLPKTNGYWNEQEKAYEEAITLAKRQVRLAGFSVEGDE